MQAAALTVSDLNEYVRKKLASDPALFHIAVRGEVSNFKQHVSGHWYFSLKDQASRIACVMFRQHNQLLKFFPRDGMQLVLIGSVGLYTAAGAYQFYAEGAVQFGMGDLYQQFLILKDKLTREGLFDPAKKRPLPLLPAAVGIVTSQTGAVLHDIRTVAERRCPGVRLILRPALVQGEGAAKDIADGIAALAAVPEVDVLIVGRGGGSLEDLWAFNEEVVVRAIARCAKPIISAIGHETDVTLADFASDVRAPTPSAAAELAVPDRAELAGRVSGLLSALRYHVDSCLDKLRMQVATLEKRLQPLQPDITIALSESRIGMARQRLDAAGDRALRAASGVYEHMLTRLMAVSPMQTLKRGYAIAMDGEHPVQSVRDVPENLTLLFHDGRARVHTLSAEKEDPFDREGP